MMSANLVSNLGEEATGHSLIMDNTGFRSAELDFGTERAIHPHEEYLSSSFVPENVKVFPMTPESTTNVQGALASESVD